MTGDTILVIDADLETEDKIVSTLESEGYIVFVSPGSKVNAEMAKKFRPALIFLKPLAPSAAGFEACRTIHTMEALKNVPIVILASLKGPIEQRYTSYYGIVDYIKLTFTPEELLEKTTDIIGRVQQETSPLPEAEIKPVGKQEDADEDVSHAGVEAGGGKEVAETAPLTEEPEEPERYRKDRFADAEEQVMPTDRSGWGKTQDAAHLYSRKASGRPGRKGLLLALGAAIAVGAAGFVLYTTYLQPQEPAIKSSPPAESQKQQAVAEPKQDAGLPPSSSQPAPLPEPEQAPAAASKPFYAVQVGAFKTEATAGALAKKFKEKGYEAYVQRGGTKDSTVVYRVLIGTLGDRKEAAALAASIGAKEKTKTTIFHSP